MTDETLDSAPELENPETPASPEAEIEQPRAVEDELNANSASDETEEEASKPEDDLDDLEWEGISAKVPKALKSQLEERLSHMSKHFTTKTQEIAESARALQERSQADEREMNARAAVVIIDEQLKAYQNINWQQWEEQDFLAAQRGWREYQQLKDLRQNAVGEFNQRYQARTEKAKQETAQRLQATTEFAQKNIKGWSPEVEDKMLDLAARKMQVDKAQVKQLLNPAYVELLHLAWIGEQALKAKPASPKPQATPEPLKVVSSKGNPAAKKSLSEMSMDEYAAARKAGRGG